MASNNFGMVFFAVGLLYALLAFVCVCRTWERLFKCQKYKNKPPMRVWRAFYAFMWIYIGLSSALYWTYFAEFVNPPASASGHLRELFRYVALSYTPVILSSLSYSLLYY